MPAPRCRAATPWMSACSTEVRTGKVWSEGQEITPPPMKGLAKNNIGKAGNGIITDISQVGGYPEYKGEPIKDLGPDGIPLSWKKKYGLDANDAWTGAKRFAGRRLHGHG